MIYPHRLVMSESAIAKSGVEPWTLL